LNQKLKQVMKWTRK